MQKWPVHDEYYVEKDVWEFPSCKTEARGMRYSCTWKETFPTQQKKIIWKCVTTLVYAIVHGILFWKFEYTQYIWNKKFNCTSNKKMLISKSEEYPVRALSIHSVALGISTRLQVEVLTKSGFQRVCHTPMISKMRWGNLSQKIFFSVSRSLAQEHWDSQITRDLYCLSCSWSYRSCFLYGNLIKKVIPSELKAIIEQ